MDYLNAYNGKRVNSHQPSFCKHYVTDMLLRMYSELASWQKTPLSIEVRLPETVVISDVDLCVVLSNLLENALEASARIPENKRYIAVRIHFELFRLGIFVENNFDGLLKVKNGRFFSSKQAGREGIGLNSVRAVCESNGGSADFYADEENVFHSEIILLAREECEV